eukprot:gene16734-163_t
MSDGFNAPRRPSAARTPHLLPARRRVGWDATMPGYDMYGMDLVLERR